MRRIEDSDGLALWIPEVYATKQSWLVRVIDWWHLRIDAFWTRGAV